MKRITKLFTALALALGLTTAASADTPRTISINFNSAKGAVTGEYGIVPSSSWNNFEGAKQTTEKAVTVSDGTTGVTAMWWSANVWDWTSATDNALKGYLDDGACGDGATTDGPHICVKNIPFDYYDVIIYYATDTANWQFNPVSIKEWTVQTKCSDMADSWDGTSRKARNDASLKFGATQQKTAIIGKNVSYLKRCFNFKNLDIKGGKNGNDARGGIAAIQIVECDPHGSEMYFNRLAGDSVTIPADTYGNITVEAPIWATQYASQTALTLSGSTEEIGGNAQYIQAKPSGDTDTRTHSVSGWFRCDGLAGEKLLYAAIAHKGDYGGYKVVVDADGAINVGQCNYYAFRTDSTVLKSADGVIAADTWYYITVAVTKSPDARTATAKVFVNGEAIDFPTGTFNTNLNGGDCIELSIGGGVSAAGLYADFSAIGDAGLSASLATNTKYVSFQKSEYAATITEATTDFSQLEWTPAKPESGFGPLDKLTISVDESVASAALTLDEDLTAAEMIVTGADFALLPGTDKTYTIDKSDFSGITGKLTLGFALSGTKTFAATPNVFFDYEYAGAPIVEKGTLEYSDADLSWTTQIAGSWTLKAANDDEVTIATSGNMRPTFNMDVTGGTVIFDPNGTKGTIWYGNNGATTYTQTGGNVYFNCTGKGQSGSGNGLLLGYTGSGKTAFELNISGGLFAVENSSLNFWNAVTMNVSGGTVRAKGVYAGGNNTYAINVGAGAAFELGSLGWKANACTFTLGGTLKAYENAVMANAITYTDGAKLVAASGTSLIIKSEIAGEGTITCGDATDDGDVVFMGVEPPEGVAGTYYYGYTVDINNAGRFDIPSGKTADQIRLFNKAGDPVPFTDKGTYLEFEFSWQGHSAWWDFEFNGNLNNAGTAAPTALTWDGGSPIPQADAYATNTLGDKVAIKIPCRPYCDPTYPDVLTVVMYGKMVAADNTVQVGIGSLTSGSKYSLFLATGDVSKNEVKLCLAHTLNEGKPATVLCEMTVPNAQTSNHLYAFVLKTVGGNTVVNTYLDGKLLQPYTYSGTITLGTGFQVGAIHGGVGDTGFNRPTADDADATLDVLLAYDVELNATVMERLALEYPYVSEKGTATRTFTSTDETWSEGTAWTQTPQSGEPVQQAAPNADTVVKATVDGDATVAMNLDEQVKYEKFNLEGDGTLTLTQGEDAVAPVVTGLSTIKSDMTLDYRCFTFGGNIEIADNTTLTFDFSTLDLSTYWSDAKIKLTGVATLGEGAQVKATGIAEVTGRTAEIIIDPQTSQCELKITVDKDPFVYTADGWTWKGEPIDAEIVSNNTAQAITVQADLEWPIDRSTFMVDAGTLKVTKVGTAAITVNGGAFDVNGLGDSHYTVTLNGGSLVNNGATIGDASQTETLALTKDSSVGGTGNFAIQASSYGPTTIDLNEYTLTKTGANRLALVTTTIEGTGTLDVEEGTLYSSEDTVFTNGVLKIGENGTVLHRSGKTFTIAKIVGEGGTLNNEGTISTFTLTGTLNIANGGTYGTITNAAGAVVNVGQKHDLVFAGAGTVNVTLTEAEYAAGQVTLFTLADEATTAVGTVMYNDVDITDKCTISGGQITAIEYPVAKIVSGETTAYYYTLNAALEAAEAGQTVTLLKDIETATPAAFVIDKSITLDFGTSTITKTVANDWVFQIAKDAEVTFKGTTGGIVHYPAVLNPDYPASMIQILGKLTVEGGEYKSDYTIFKVDEDDAATHTAKGELVVNGGTFTIAPQTGTTYKGATYAVMNWSKATLNGGTFTGDITALSYDGNTVSKAGETIVGTVGGSPVYKLQVTGSTYENVPKIKGVAKANVTLVKSASIKDTLFLIEAGDYVTVAGNPEAKIGDVYYLTFAEALEAATTGQTVELLKSITTDKAAAFAIAKNITVDFGTSTITKTVANDWVFDITTNVTVVFKGTTGGITQTASNLNPDSPASMIRNKGILTVEGGVYTSDFCIIKNDEDPGAGELTVTGGTFNMVRTTGGYEGLQMALMNWATATISGGTWNGTIGTRSCDRNNVSKAGATTIGTLEGSPSYLLYVGYEGDTTWTNMPKIAGVAIADVTLDKNPSVTDELEKVQDGDWVTAQVKSGGTEVVPGQPVHCDTLLEAEKATVALDENQKTLDPEQQTEYANLFTKVIIGSQETGYTVSFLPTEDTVTSVSNAVVEADKELLSEITPGETVEVSIETKPGLYYSVAVSETLSTKALEVGEGDRTMGTGEPLDLEVTTPEEATKCFYQIMVNVTDKKVGEAK